MSENKLSKELEIKNQKGLHARAAAAFVKTADGADDAGRRQRHDYCRQLSGESGRKRDERNCRTG